MDYRVVLVCLCLCVACGQESLQESLQQASAASSEGSLPKVESNAKLDSSTIKDVEGDRVDIIDYTRRQILGFMIVRNGKIIKRVVFKEPRELELDSSHNLELESTPSLERTTPALQTTRTQEPAQTPYEQQVSNAPKDTRAPTRSRHLQGNIKQEIGAESMRINPIYKNRQWDKSRIIHEIKEEKVIELER